MADVTDQDRAKAIDVLASARADAMWMTANPVDLVTRIADALADARAAARCWNMADDENPDCPIGSARCVRPTGHDGEHVWEARPS